VLVFHLLVFIVFDFFFQFIFNRLLELQSSQVDVTKTIREEISKIQKEFVSIFQSESVNRINEISKLTLTFEESLNILSNAMVKSRDEHGRNSEFLERKLSELNITIKRNIDSISK
jgi:hypothetical protein